MTKTELIINKILDGIFSVPSLYVHTFIFSVWFLFKLDMLTFTTLISIEAIYIGLFVGIQQLGHHKAIKQHLERNNRGNNV